MVAWFLFGAEVAGLVPTAINQQNLIIGVEDREPFLRMSGGKKIVYPNDSEVVSEHPIQTVEVGTA